MTDTSKLKAVIENKGIKCSFLADKLGISRQAFSNKLNNKTPFKATEIKIICDTLDINKRDCFIIFLSWGWQNGDLWFYNFKKCNY